VSTPAPPKASVPPPRVKTADEVIAELSTSITDLHFLRDALEGADFIQSLVKEKFPSEVVLIWFHDSAKRELVLVRQTGGTTDQHLSRISDKMGLAQAALRSQRAVVIPDATRDPRANEARWKNMGITPKSIVVAPVMHSGKPYGLLEILNPTAGGRFSTVENNGLTYLGQQLAEFIASNGTILDSDRIMAGAKRIAS
jgi:GAF domain-containing protein